MFKFYLVIISAETVGRRHHHLNKLYLHVPKDYIYKCAISENFVEQFWDRDFSKVCIQFVICSNCLWKLFR